MKRNIEIKFKISRTDFQYKTENAIKLSGLGTVQIIQQEDIFYHCSTGRLKLRIFNESGGELIWYARENQSGPKMSQFTTSVTKEPRSLDLVLRNSCGYRGVVKKIRYLVLIGQTRVHFDKVEGLGTFGELEVVLEEKQSQEEGEKIAKEIMEKLGIKNEDLIECAYIDLIEKKE